MYRDIVWIRSYKNIGIPLIIYLDRKLQYVYMYNVVSPFRCLHFSYKFRILFWEYELLSPSLRTDFPERNHARNWIGEKGTINMRLWLDLLRRCLIHLLFPTKLESQMRSARIWNWCQRLREIEWSEEYERHNSCEFSSDVMSLMMIIKTA